jgi:hypothetical protein
MTDLIQRLQDGESGNALDVLIEVALSPLNRRANSAGTKVIYTDETGESTHWAPDWSLKPDRAIAALRAKDNGNGE